MFAISVRFDIPGGAGRPEAGQTSRAGARAGVARPWPRQVDPARPDELESSDGVPARTPAPAKLLVTRMAVAGVLYGSAPCRPPVPRGHAMRNRIIIPAGGAV